MSEKVTPFMVRTAAVILKHSGALNAQHGQTADGKYAGQIAGIPDGTGPRGAGNGPGKGQADGSGAPSNIRKILMALKEGKELSDADKADLNSFMSGSAE